MTAQRQDRFTLREKRAREKAGPILSREHRDILVGRPYGVHLEAFLEEHGIRGILAEESFVDILQLSDNTGLDQVQHLLDEWMDGADFTPGG